MLLHFAEHLYASNCSDHQIVSFFKSGPKTHHPRYFFLCSLLSFSFTQFAQCYYVINTCQIKDISRGSSQKCIIDEISHVISLNILVNLDSWWQKHNNRRNHVYSKHTANTSNLITPIICQPQTVLGNASTKLNLALLKIQSGWQAHPV